MTTESDTFEKNYYGCHFNIEKERQDSTYHDRREVRLTIYDADTGESIHTIEKVGRRSSHQLSKRYKAPDDPTDSAIYEAQAWVQKNHSKSVEMMQEVRTELRQKELTRRRELFGKVAHSEMDYLLELLGETKFKTREAAEILGMGSVQKANKLLCEWGFQEKTETSPLYKLNYSELGELAGMFGQVVWNIRGLKAIWDKGVRIGFFSRGENGFVQQVKATTEGFEMAPKSQIE
jgi:hypothetical protein